MIEKIVAGKRYRVDLSELADFPNFIEAIKKYSNNGVILISKFSCFHEDTGLWEYGENDKKKVGGSQKMNYFH